MKKFFGYIVGVVFASNAIIANAAEKFDVLPDLPEALSYAVQPASAATVTGGVEPIAMTSQSIGNEPNFISVIFSLLFVIVLIYLTGVIYAKLNNVGLKTLKKQHDFNKAHVSVISTTQLGNNKTLHVVELDGKRMLIGASSTAIQLIKDLGSVSDGENESYSSIEIPNIKIPKIEIPKIEIPTINFSKLVTKTHKAVNLDDEAVVEDKSVNTNVDVESVETEEACNNIVEEENPEIIIDSLFKQSEPLLQEEQEEEKKIASEHIVDPDDFVLYKKYLG